MSTQSQIIRISTAKESIKSALNVKGLSIADSDKIDTYATYIESMPTIYTSTSTPSGSDGKNGDIWLVKA